MIGMSYGNLQTKGVLEVAGFGPSVSEANLKKERSCASNEPISVLDTRRSPSPSTSTSTLSSSFGGTNGGGGGGGSASTDNTIGLGAVPENTGQQKWLGYLPPETNSVAVNETVTAGSGGWKEEWAGELQTIPAGLEVGPGGSERFELGLEDLDGLLSESGQDQSLLRWITDDVDDTSFTLKQLLHSGNPSEIDGNVAHSSGSEPSAIDGLSGANIVSSISSALAVSDSGTSMYSNNHNNNGKSGLVPNSLGLNNNGNPQNPSFSLSSGNLAVPPGMIPQQQHHQLLSAPEEKVQIFNPQMLMNQSQLLNPLLYGTQQEHHHQFQPQPKRHNPGTANSVSQIPKVPFTDPGHDFLVRKQQQLPLIQQPQLGLSQQLNLLPQHLQQKPFMVPKQETLEMVARPHHQQQEEIYDQLYKAAELIYAGNFSNAQRILARLNHQLSPAVKPFQRAAYYLKEALQLPLLLSNSATPLPPRVPTPFDGMFKMGAYKVLSEISPLIHFMNFTSNQVFLEALDDAEHIHIIDFDIEFGAQWSSFMQELPRRNKGVSSLKITAFASPSTHHPIELGLMHENLTQFANDMGVNFELEVINFDTFDPSSYSMFSSGSSENEAIAVNFPVWSTFSHLPVLPSILRFIKQLSPKIVVSLDNGCGRTELSFSHHLLHALQYYDVLLDSIDAANVTLETTSKIERFLFQPKIESIVFGRLQAPDLMLPWKSFFASAGFSPVVISNFTETQAEYVVKKTQITGFCVEKRQGLLLLCWQGHELVSASAWSC
ncbi:unnamed protein product [Ilex paraguariensis]|uniref:Scarecrow-like protein 6 n=1 Tax=Ilex paraguariensis TaxID=185542 RepID=A0ABC8ULK4_9AQUA